MLHIDTGYIDIQASLSSLSAPLVMYASGVLTCPLFRAIRCHMNSQWRGADPNCCGAGLAKSRPPSKILSSGTFWRRSILDHICDHVPEEDQPRSSRSPIPGDESIVFPAYGIAGLRWAAQFQPPSRYESFLNCFAAFRAWFILPPNNFSCSVRSTKACSVTSSSTNRPIRPLRHR